MKKQLKKKDSAPREPKELSPSKPKKKSPSETKESSASKSTDKSEKRSRSLSPGKPNVKPNRTVEDAVNRALLRHDRIVQKEEEQFRLAVIDSSRRAVSGVDGQNELTRRALQAKLQELIDQRTVFEEVSRRIWEDQGFCEPPLEEQARWHLLKRELFRFSARLPALAKRLEIERYLSSTESRFTVVQGQTGSGKSTQIPQYAADLPCFAGKRIICTQPRKLAAISLATRVAYEYSAGWDKAPVGGDVGYRVGGRFKASKRTRIEYVTEAVLLDMIARARCGTDSNPFDDVGCIIVDEAHERSIICDLIMGSLRENHAQWRHVKVAITSATIDLDLFSGFFDNAPVVEIPGRMFPVDVQYVGSGGQPSGVADSSNIAAVVSKCAVMIQQTFPDWRDGDILCFLPGQDDVLRAKDMFDASIARLIKISPGGERSLLERVQSHALFGKQDADEQALVFKKQPENRKVIFSTDVAETSVTIDGVVFVVDSGLRKAMVYDPMRNMSSLKVHNVSRSSALQRCGRAGRTRPGQCFRLYTQQDFEEMEIGNAAEIFQQPLTLALLTLYNVGIVPHEFHWIEAPNEDALKRAQAELLYLGAIDVRGAVTPLGRLIAEVQVDPKIVRLIERSAQNGLTKVGVDLAAVISVSSIAYYRGNKNDKASRTEAEAKQESLLIPDQGDVVSLYRTYRAWKSVLEGTDSDDNETLSPPKPEITVDDDDDVDKDDDNNGWAATFAKHALQLKMNAIEATRLTAMFAGTDEDDDDDGNDKKTTYQLLKDDDDDDTMSVVSIASDTSVVSTASDVSTTNYKKPKRKLNEKKARAWCLKNGVNSKAMGIARATAKELLNTFSRAKSWMYPAVKDDEADINPNNDQLRRLITAGYFLNAAVSKPKMASMSRRGGPQYFALYSGVLGSFFFGTSVHILEKQCDAVPSWILFDSILRLGTTTHLKLATPIEEAWIKEESSEFYELCMRNRSELPVLTIEFGDLPLALLRNLFGKSYQQLNRWETQLKCTMGIDRNVGTLTVYCAPVHEPRIQSVLSKRIATLKKRLEDETTEEAYMGTTRAVIGNGFQVQELLFDKDFSAITVRNLSDQSDREVENRLLQWVRRAGCLDDVVRSADVLRHTNSATPSVSAIVKFTSKDAAFRVYEIIRGDSNGSGGDTVSVSPLRVVSSQSKVAAAGAEFAGRIKLTWADGEATGDAKVFFRTAIDANAFVRNARVVLESTTVRASAVGQRSDSKPDNITAGQLPVIGRGGNRTPPKPNSVGGVSSVKPGNAASQQSSAPTKQELTGTGKEFRVIYDTEAIDRLPLEEQARLRFCVHLKGGIPVSMDEVELLEKIQPTTAAIAYAKIVRKPVAASTRSDETMARELEVRFRRMLPLLTCLDDTAVHTDYVDQSMRRAGVVVFCRDLPRLNETYQMARDSPLWEELEKPYGQPIRMEIEHSYTTTLHADMHRCFRNQIAQILTYARAKGAMCQESHPKSLAANAAASKNMVTLKFMGEMPVLQRIKAKVEESLFCEKVESNDLHWLFTVTGRRKVSDWMDKHIDENAAHLRYFIRWITKTKEFWVYGDAPSRAYAIEELLKLASDIKSLQVVDKYVRLYNNKIQIKAWLAKAPTARALFTYFVQSNRRIVVSGSEEQVNALMLALDAEKLLFKPHKRDAKAQEAARPDCGLCYSTAEETNVLLTVCNHTFCLDCIQPMLGSSTVDLPVRCPAMDCGCPLHVDDIVKILVEADAIASIIETTVFDYVGKHRDVALVCPRPGCNQILNAKSIMGGGSTTLGGRYIYCDQCEESYCLDCTEVAGGRPVPRHAKQTCEQFRAQQVSPQVAQHLRAIQEQILNVSCPHCHCVFLDFTGCTSVQCGNTTCKHYFCANCLVYSSTSSNDTHHHVSRCPNNPNPASSGGIKGYFVTDQQLASTHHTLRVRKVEAYFREKLVSESVRGAVYKRIAKDLQDLGIDLPAHLRGKDDGFSFEQEAIETPEDTAVRRHVNHMREKLLNMRCPKCGLVFVDFDFDTCAALTCANPQCKGGFCAYCLEDCGGDAHQHVSKCLLNPNRPYFYVTEEQFQCVHNERRAKLVNAYLCDVKEKEGEVVAQRLHSALVNDFRSIGVDITVP